MKIEERIKGKIREIREIEDSIPSIIIIHNIQEGFTVEYMSKRGQKILNIGLEELQALGLQYHDRFFNPEDAVYYVPKLQELLNRNDMDEVFTFFQQVRPSPEHAWQWHLSSIKLLMRDDEAKPLLTLTMATPIDPQNHVTQKVERLLEENTFMRNNFEKYASLTPREREILKNIAEAKTNKEIADELFMSISTVETHKKNIKKKLKVKTGTELVSFGRAFEL
jgi:DNA-binding CsgD family transcriptional regulator